MPPGAGMLSNVNVQAFDDAGLRFFVGSRQTKARQDLGTYFRWHGSHHGGRADRGHHHHAHQGRRPVPHRQAGRTCLGPGEDTDQWRAVWQYRRKRAVRDRQTLNQQRNRALAIIEGQSRPKSARFVRTTGNTRSFDEASYNVP